MTILQKILLGLIRFYQRYLSILKPACCRFQPRCSEYAFQALSKHGCIRGSLLSLWRLARCHPFYHGSVYDPVPGTETDKQTDKQHE
ncbi:MAG: membrane protein insertion efficiency factor YidD [Lentisphaeria bacterium]